MHSVQHQAPCLDVAAVEKPKVVPKILVQPAGQHSRHQMSGGRCVYCASYNVLGWREKKNTSHRMYLLLCTTATSTALPVVIYPAPRTVNNRPLLVHLDALQRGSPEPP